MTHKTIEPILAYFDKELKGGWVKPTLEAEFCGWLYFSWGDYDLCVSSDWIYDQAGELVINSIETIYFNDCNNEEIRIGKDTIFFHGISNYLKDHFRASDYYDPRKDLSLQTQRG